MRLISDEKGFTFLEMCVVVAIISILMVIAVPNYQSALANAQKKSCEATMRLIETQLDSYFLDNNKYPEGSDTATRLEKLKSDKYIKDIPSCPSSGNYTISTNNNVVSVSCSIHTNNPVQQGTE